MTKNTKITLSIVGVIVFLVIAIGGWFIMTQNSLRVQQQKDRKSVV